MYTEEEFFTEDGVGELPGEVMPEPGFSGGDVNSNTWQAWCGELTGRMEYLEVGLKRAKRRVKDSLAEMYDHGKNGFV